MRFVDLTTCRFDKSVLTNHQQLLKMHPIIQTLHDHLPTLKAKYPLQSLAVFGSYSRGTQTPNSDLDVLYEALPNTFLTLYNYMDLQQDLAEITILKIDLVNIKKGVVEYYIQFVNFYASNFVLVIANALFSVLCIKFLRTLR
jgi:predicted nucleotidyltransferase